MAGYGNKKSSFNVEGSDEQPHFDVGHRDPYSGSNEFGSGTTGGAGWGNKTGSHAESHDSIVGKIVEKTGHIVHSEKITEKGHKMREESGYVGGAGGGGEIQGGIENKEGRRWDERDG